MSTSRSKPPKASCIDDDKDTSEYLTEIESGDIKVSYPLFFDPITFETYPLPPFFGGTILNDDDAVSKNLYLH